MSQLQAKEEILCVLKNSAAAEGEGVLTPQEMTDISEAISSPIGIKQLLETLEMAQSDAQQDGEEGRVTASLFLSCLHVRGF